MRRVCIILAPFLVLFHLHVPIGFAEDKKPALFNYATISKTQMVFCYANDLWIVNRDGGEAKQLTRMSGEEQFPTFSPDGKQVGFSSDYGDIYVVSAAGGEPRRLTYHPDSYWYLAIGWLRNGKSVMFSSFPPKYNRLYSVPFEGGLVEELPLPLAVWGSFSPDERRIAYCPTWSFPEWKQYRGGRMARIWITDLPDCHIEKIPRNNSNDSMPMWIENQIYFLSDRNGLITLFAYDVKKKKVIEVIHNPGTDILWASNGPGAIVYGKFGAIHIYDLNTGKSIQPVIRVSSDMYQRKPRSVRVLDNLAGVRLSPTGDRVLIEARGEVLTVSAGQSQMQNLTNSPGVRERFPVWSPDGKRIAYFSDESGEYALHIRNSNGMGEVIKIVLFPGFYFSPVWSPDSKKVAYKDHQCRLWYVDIDKTNPICIDANTYTQERFWTRIESPPPTWSPDSCWLSYTKILKNHFRALYIYSLETNQSRQVTDGLCDIISPQFDQNGKYLYFGASTDIGPSLGDDLSAGFYSPTYSIFTAILRKGLTLPLLPEDEDAGPVMIDFDRFTERIVALPIPARNYKRIVVGKPGVLFLLENTDQPRFYLTALHGEDRQYIAQSLYRFGLISKKTDKIIEGILDFDLSPNGENILYKLEDRWTISSDSIPLKNKECALKLDSLQVRIDPALEWKQTYHEVWRSIRDFFYDPGFHGVDLTAREKKFEQYLESVACPNDLNSLYQEMLSELRVSHLSAYAGIGLEISSENASVGLLGADYEIENGRYRFARIYSGDIWSSNLRGPLAYPGMDIKQGDFLIAVDGRELRASDDINRFFEDKTGKEVLLCISEDAGGAHTREVKVVPINSGFDYLIRYFNRMEDNRRKVDKLTNGRVAYIYLPDEGEAGVAAFNRYFFAQSDKEAIIVDGRWSTGGMLPDYFINYLGQKVQAYVTTRADQNFTSPYSVILGPKVMITNEYTFCSGEALAFFFKRSGLGPLIGTRTSGGLVGPVGYLSLMDGGVVIVPAYALYSPEGMWLAENEGVAPDIEIEQDPAAVQAGYDPQLEKAVEVIMKVLKKNPPSLIKRPPYKKMQ